MTILQDTKRNKAVRITLYNHKGGVGKTTLTANIAAALAMQNKTVLLVDSDSQCNLTSYFYEEAVVDNLLDEADSDSGRTIWSALRPIVNAEGDPAYIEPYPTPIDGVWLLPGDIRLAEFENSLNGFWNDCFQNIIRGHRGTNSLSIVVNQAAEKISADFVLYDTGPNIGPLNRAILLDCDYFVVPAAPDLFSRRALKTLGHTISRWISSWNMILKLAPKNSYTMPGRPKLLGYIPQRFKIYRGIMTAASVGYLSKIEKSIDEDLVKVLKQENPELEIKTIRGMKLGEVKDYTSLVQEAQAQGVPLWDVAGGIEGQKEQALKTFKNIAEKIISKTSIK